MSALLALATLANKVMLASQLGMYLAKMISQVLHISNDS